ncbi:hypothetical protein [Deinococcus sp.]|uniref:hypothetical protein n=1 Tax=Deinococcus sp. TaxID=47478 RepID=UPI003B5CA23D
MTAALLTACQRGPDQGELDKSAQFFLDNGGLGILNTASRTYTRPCLQILNMKNTLLGGPIGSPDALITFIEKHRLAKTVHQDRPSGYEGVSLTPLPPYEANWVGKQDFKSFCFGKPTLINVELVADAKPITAGEREAYIIAGTEARATRLTFKLDNLPGGDFVSDLAQQPTLLARGSMKPDDYGRALTVIATLPLKAENYDTTP